MAGSSQPSPWCPMPIEAGTPQAPARPFHRWPHLVPALSLVFALGVTLPATASDFADGLMGGPDVWEVRGLEPGHELELHAGPSSRDSVLARFANGARLTNMGCAMKDDERWCQVAPREGGKPTGWVQGRFLREGAP